MEVGIYEVHENGSIMFVCDNNIFLKNESFSKKYFIENYFILFYF